MGWKCTIDDNYEVGSPIEKTIENTPDSEITDWGKIGTLPEKSLQLMNELENLIRGLSYRGQLPLEQIRAIDSIATDLYDDASRREDKPPYEQYDPRIHGKNSQSYHFYALKVSTKMMLKRARELTALLDLDPMELKKAVINHEDLLLGDDLYVSFSIDSMESFKIDIKSMADECLLRMDLIRRLSS